MVNLAREYGILLGKGVEVVQLARAPADIATALGLPSRSPLLVLDRVIFTLDGRPAEWRIGHCNLRDKQYVAALS